jgi:hypothetical protein
MSWSWGKGTSAICWRITPPNTMGCAFEDVPSATCWDREFADSPLEEAVSSELVSEMPFPWLLGKIQGILLQSRRERL